MLVDINFFYMFYVVDFFFCLRCNGGVLVCILLCPFGMLSICHIIFLCIISSLMFWGWAVWLDAFWNAINLSHNFSLYNFILRCFGDGQCGWMCSFK
jgi:hypothetical protein